MTNLSRLRLRRMFNTRSERFRRWLFNTRSERFRRWLVRRMETLGRPAVPFSNQDLSRLFRVWAMAWCPEALKDEENGPQPRMG